LKIVYNKPPEKHHRKRRWSKARARWKVIFKRYSGNCTCCFVTCNADSNEHHY
jgi:hypothetical protein